MRTDHINIDMQYEGLIIPIQLTAQLNSNLLFLLHYSHRYSSHFLNLLSPHLPPVTHQDRQDGGERKSLIILVSINGVVLTLLNCEDLPVTARQTF